MFNKIFKNISIVKNNTYIFIGLLVFVFLGGFFFVNYSKDNKIEASTTTGIALSELTHSIVNSSKATISFKVDLVSSTYATTGGRNLCWSIYKRQEPASDRRDGTCTDVTSRGSYAYNQASDTETLDINISSFNTGDVIYYWGSAKNGYGSAFTEVRDFKIVFADLTADITKSSPESIGSSVFISSVTNVGSFGTSFNNNSNLKDVAFHVTGGRENEESPSSPGNYQSYSSSSNTKINKDDNITPETSRTFESTSIDLDPGYYFARACVITYDDGNPDNDCSNWLKFKVPKDFSISISGDGRVGNSLSVSTNPSDADVDYQWQRADSRYSTYRNISGATNSSYILTSADYNKYIKAIVSGDGIYEGENIDPKDTEAVGPVKNIEDQTKRISFWPGKVNQHYDISSGSWETDSDGVSGGWSSVDYDDDWGDNPVGYCEYIYSDDFDAVSFYQNERITTWKNRGNVGGPFTDTRPTYACLEDENTNETGTWTYLSECPTDCGYKASTISQTCIGPGPCSGDPQTSRCSATSACPVPSGSLSVSGCIIPIGSSTCSAKINSWNVSNPITGADTAITTNYQYPNTTVTGTTENSGTSKSHTVYYGDNLFFLYHNEVELNKATATATCVSGSTWDTTTSSCKQDSAGGDIRRISFWPGKVNQHYDINSGSWETDPDRVSGGWSSVDYSNDWGDDPVGYCEYIYDDDFDAVSFYQYETITTWKNRGNVGGPFTAKRPTYACLEDENTDETGTWTYLSECPTDCGYEASAISQTCIGPGSCSGKPEMRRCSATSACPSGALAVQNCKIQENQNTCVASVDSWNVSNPITGADTAITTNYPSANAPVAGISTTSGAGKSHTVYYSEENIFYLYHNEVLLGTAEQSALCNDGLVWDTTSKSCKKGETTTPSGSLFVSGCNIQIGQSTCSATINSWSVTNPVSGANTAVTTNYPSANTPVAETTTISGSNKTHSITNGSNLFFLYHNKVKLDEATATASCVSGSNWDGDSCEQIDPTSTIGQLSVNDCTIERGYSQCNVSLSWSVTNPNSTTSSKVTTKNSNGTDYTVNSSNTGNTIWPVSYGTREFKLWDNGSILDTKSGRASCSNVDMWDGNKCIKKPNGEWTSWSPVNTTCDYTYTQRRNCVGGSDCIGESERTVTNICIEDNCPDCLVDCSKCPSSLNKNIPKFEEN